MFDHEAWNSRGIVYRAEKKVHGRWQVWRYSTYRSYRGTTKGIKVYRLKEGETHWFRIAAMDSYYLAESDPIRFQTRPSGNRHV